MAGSVIFQVVNYQRNSFHCWHVELAKGQYWSNIKTLEHTPWEANSITKLVKIVEIVMSKKRYTFTTVLRLLLQSSRLLNLGPPDSSHLIHSFLVPHPILLGVLGESKLIGNVDLLTACKLGAGAAQGFDCELNLLFLQTNRKETGRSWIGGWFWKICKEN